MRLKSHMTFSTQATPHEFFQDVNPNDCFLVVSSEQTLKQGTYTSVPVHTTNAQGENIVFRDPTLLQIEGAVNLSTSERVSIENERAPFDETVSALRMASIESTVPLPEGCIVGKLNHMRERYPLQSIYMRQRSAKTGS